jgi:hypothetical protein
MKCLYSCPSRWSSVAPSSLLAVVLPPRNAACTPAQLREDDAFS